MPLQRVVAGIESNTEKTVGVPQPPPVLHRYGGRTQNDGNGILGRRRRSSIARTS